MRKFKLLAVLLSIALLVSAGRERVDDGYSYRKLVERQLNESGESRNETSSGSPAGLSQGNSSNNFAHGSSYRSDEYYDKEADMETLYYYNT